MIGCSIKPPTAKGKHWIYSMGKYLSHTVYYSLRMPASGLQLQRRNATRLTERV